MGVGFFEGGGETSRSWPAMPVGGYPSPGAQLHAGEIFAYLPSPRTSATPALIAETRRQLRGCMASVEADLLREVGSDPDKLAGHVWRMLLHRPDLLPAPLFAHLRARAALVLMMPSERAGSDGSEDVAATLQSALRLGQARWAQSHDPEAPIIADLPAERYVDLVWLTAAFVADALAAQSLASPDAIALTVCAAAERLFDRHDEAVAPIALSQRIAAMEDVDIGASIAEGDHLLFLAIIALRAKLSLSILLDAMAQAELGQWLALCRAGGCSPSEAAAWLSALAAIRLDMDLDMMVALSRRYQTLDPATVEAMIAPLRVPEPLAALLSRLGGGRE